MLAQRLGIDQPTDAHVARIAVIAVDMDDELAADRYVDRRADADVVGGAAIACECVDMHGFFGNAARNAAIEDVDRSADRLARKEQPGGAAQKLDALGGQRVEDRKSAR